MSRLGFARAVGRAAVVFAAVTALCLSPIASASATDGSVPAEVTSYLANDLAADLAEYYGPGVGGTGIAFDETTAAAPASRVFEFTADFVAGVDRQPVARRLNEWISMVSLAGTPAGVATIAIDDATVEPELASFSASPTLVTALSALPATGMLVHDSPRAAWLIVDGDTVTPLFAGISGLTAPTTVTAYRARVARQTAVAGLAVAPADDQPNGLIIAGLVLLLIVLLLAVEAFLPSWRRRVLEPDEAPAVEPEPRIESAPKRAPRVPATAASETAPVVTPRVPRVKPAASE